MEPIRRRADPFKKQYGGFKGFGKAAFGGVRGKKDVFRAPEIRAPELEDPDFENLLRKLHSPVLVKRVQSLKAQFPDGTVPELVTMDWLNGQQMKYIYQAQYGRYAHRGLILPDFVIDNAGTGAAWQIQGEYWHTKHKTPESDRAQKQRILNQEVEGIRIKQYVELWENDIYHKSPQVFIAAMSGVQLR